MTHRFLYWPEDDNEEEDIPASFEKITRLPKMKGEYVRERDARRTHQSEKDLYPEG